MGIGEHTGCHVGENIGSSGRNIEEPFAGTGISSVSGTISDGSTLTISGGGFGTKTTAEPILWDNYSDGSLGSSLLGRSVPIGIAGAYRVSEDEQGYYNPPIISNDRSMSNDRCSKMPWDGVGPWGDGEEFPKVGNITGSNINYYIAYWVYWTRPGGTGTKAIWKWIRISGSETLDAYSRIPRTHEAYWTEENGTINWAPVEIVDNNVSGIYANDYNDPNPPTSYGSSIDRGPVENEWSLMEYYFQSSTPNVADGNFKKWVNGYLVTNFENVTTRQIASEYDFIMSCFNGIGAVDYSATEVNQYLDNYWIDNTPQRVVIGNNSTWSTCTTKDPQPATVWTPNGQSIIITANIPNNYTTNDTIYFYVVDNNNDPIDTNGFQKTVE